MDLLHHGQGRGRVLLDHGDVDRLAAVDQRTAVVDVGGVLNRGHVADVDVLAGLEWGCCPFPADRRPWRWSAPAASAPGCTDCPTARRRCPFSSAATTSSGDKLWARSRSGSTVMTIARVLLPKGEKETVPGTCATQHRADADTAPGRPIRPSAPGLAVQHQVADGDVGRVEPHHEGRQHAGRHLPAGTIRQADHLRHRRRHVGAGIEGQLEQHEVLDVLRLDPLEPVDVLEVLLVDVGDDPLDLARGPCRRSCSPRRSAGR